MAAKRKIVKPTNVTTVEDVALFLGVSARQVQSYLARGCPGRPGNYPLDKIVAWAKENVWAKRRTHSKRNSTSSRRGNRPSWDFVWQMARSGRTASLQSLADIAGVDVTDVEDWRTTDETFPIAPDGSVSLWNFCLWAKITGRAN